MSRQSYVWNAFESDLSSSITDVVTTIALTSVTGLREPGYLTIDPDDPALREVIRYETISGTDLQTVTRGLPGSTAGGQAHNISIPVRSVISHQLIDDLNADIIDLETFETAHDGSTDGHPDATASADGLATAAQITKLDGIAPGAVAAHADTTGKTIDDHHARDHDIDGAEHTASGLTAGHSLVAVGPTSFVFQFLNHADLQAVEPDQHHDEIHTLGGAAHTGQLNHDTDLTGVSINDHHNRDHAIDGSNHSGTLDHDEIANQAYDDHHYPLIAVQFGREGIVANLSGAVAVPGLGTSVLLGAMIPWDFSFAGWGFHLDAEVGAGDITVFVSVRNPATFSSVATLDTQLISSGRFFSQATGGATVRSGGQLVVMTLTTSSGFTGPSTLAGVVYLHQRSEA